MPRRILMVAALLIALLTPLVARADAVVEELLVRRKDDNVNIRVTLRNPSAARQPGPIVIDLFVRRDESSEWQKVKTWNDIKFLQPGYKVSRDFFAENSALLKELAATGRFQARATVSAPGLRESAEKTSWWDGE